MSASAVGGWESGREPGGEVREKYAYFLDGARTRLDAATAAAAEGQLGDDKPAGADWAVGLDDADVDVLPAPQSCVLCGQPARHQVEGFPLLTLTSLPEAILIPMSLEMALWPARCRRDAGCFRHAMRTVDA